MTSQTSQQISTILILSISNPFGRLVMCGLFCFKVSNVFAQLAIYWTSTDDSGAYVMRANGDGSNPRPIVSGGVNILGPTGLETANGLLYWSALNDDYGGGIRRSSLQGLDRINLYNAPPGTAVRGLVVLAQTTPPTPSPRLSDLAILPGYLSLRLETEPGLTYALELSTDLTSWRAVTNFVSTGTSSSLTLPIPPEAQSLYLRALAQ